MVIKIGNQKIKAPLSHPLFNILAMYPDYNFNLARIVNYVESKYKSITIIDIGANIGDTVAFIRNFSDAPILCIDGEKKYLEILNKNISFYKDIEVCEALVGKENKKERIKLKSKKGTAQV